MAEASFTWMPSTRATITIGYGSPIYKLFPVLCSTVSALISLTTVRLPPQRQGNQQRSTVPPVISHSASIQVAMTNKSSCSSMIQQCFCTSAHTVCQILKIKYFEKLFGNTLVFRHECTCTLKRTRDIKSHVLFVFAKKNKCPQYINFLNLVKISLINWVTLVDFI